MKFLRVGLCFDTGVLASRKASRFLTSLDVIVFPELVDGGYAALADGAAPHRLNDPLISSFQDTSREFPLTSIAGSTFFKHGTSPATNTSLVFNRGKLIHWYDKVHLFKPMHDDRYFSPGRIMKTFTLRSGSLHLKAGVVICYDLRFPELIRKLAKRGMQVLFVPARWPKARDDAWQTLLRARAIENQIFVIGCNALGREGGYSYAFDPLGRIMFSNRGRTHLKKAAFRLDPHRLVEALRLHRNLDDAVLLK